MRDVTVELKGLRLHGMAGAWVDLVEQAGNSALDTSRWLVEHLLQAETTDRAIRSVSHQMNAAKFPVHRDLAGFDFKGSPVDRKLIHQLAELTFTEAGQNGGGSIGWIDGMGVLNVGPLSAGANPGPACYMRGGSLPTVTDSNVVLGYLNPEYLLGGRLKIDAKASQEAITTHLATRLGVSVEKAAYGIFSIVNNNMVNGIRRVSIERGYDPRDFVLIGAGGATALHITAMAKEIGIRTVLVPKLASGLCAFGQILSDVKYNYMAATPMRLDIRADLDRLEQRFAELESVGMATLQSEGITRDCIAFKRSIDMRYVGQVHECSVDIGTSAVSARTIEGIKAAFHQLHKQLFTYDEPDSLIEIVNIEATVFGKTELLSPAQLPTGGNAAGAIKIRRPMIFGADLAAIETPVYDGTRLGAGDVVDGPAVIEEPTTTIVVQPGWQARLDASSCYVISAQG